MNPLLPALLFALMERAIVSGTLEMVTDDREIKLVMRALGMKIPVARMSREEAGLGRPRVVG